MGLITSPEHELLPAASYIAWALFAPKAQPHEVERSAHTNQEADQGQVGGVEEAIRRPADAAPEEKAGDQVAEDRPEGVFVAAVTWIVAHAAMVDEF